MGLVTRRTFIVVVMVIAVASRSALRIDPAAALSGE
jgi:hypothetical protein